ncbi:family 1 glycosylhydrolase [Leifsonia poae]|uniref:family 1 glycosylhydrolase n=1 Tax=Leifsonia poae TaxID=110933 RepID=UPI001CC04759|nr:family 1 glycosylhydrolase [Leifsonia poae]
MNDRFDSDRFVWLAGIEDTCVYPPGEFEMRPLDEYDLTEHTLHWREDLDAVRSLGASAVRYGVNWPLVHPAEGEFDWTMLDERLDYATRELGLTVVADLVHYGTPTWLTASFADARYPAAVADFAGRFAARYRGVVDHITPLNEPLTTASFCGLRGIWPPALTGWDGWTRVTLGIVHGMAATIDAVRAANPEAVIVHVEASSLYRSDDPGLQAHANLLESVGLLPTDLLLGLVGPDHDRHDWLLAHGAHADELARLTENPPTIDIMGVNYYPDLSPRTLTGPASEVVQHATNRWTDGLAQSLRRYEARYGLPLLITETSIEGDDETRTSWFDASTRLVDELREDGMDIRGYTWWPLLDFVDWSYATGGRNVEEFALPDELVQARRSSTDVLAAPDGTADTVVAKTPFLRRMGLLRLDETPDGSLDRVWTDAAHRYQQRAAESLAASDADESHA